MWNYKEKKVQIQIIYINILQPQTLTAVHKMESKHIFLAKLYSNFNLNVRPGLTIWVKDVYFMQVRPSRLWPRYTLARC